MFEFDRVDGKARAHFTVTSGARKYNGRGRKAALAVSAGMCNVAVLFWGKAGWQLGPRGTQVPDRAPRVEEFSWQLAGGYYTTWYALWAQRYMHEFKVTSEDLAELLQDHAPGDRAGRPDNGGRP